MFTNIYNIYDLIVVAIHDVAKMEVNWVSLSYMKTSLFWDFFNEDPVTHHAFFLKPGKLAKRFLFS